MNGTSGQIYLLRVVASFQTALLPLLSPLCLPIVAFIICTGSQEHDTIAAVFLVQGCLCATSCWARRKIRRDLKANEGAAASKNSAQHPLAHSLSPNADAESISQRSRTCGAPCGAGAGHADELRNRAATTAPAGPPLGRCHKRLRQLDNIGARTWICSSEAVKWQVLLPQVWVTVTALLTHHHEQ